MMCRGTTTTSSSSSSTAEKEAAEINHNNSNNDDDDKDTAAFPTKRPKLCNFARVVDPHEKWILVEEGSFQGRFNWVPKCFRDGPWNIACCCYLAALIYWILLNCVECYVNPPPERTTTTTTTTTTTSFDYYHPVYSWQWWTNVVGTAWTYFVAYRVAQSDLGIFSWMSYTLQSWTLIMARYTLCTLTPWFPTLARWSEAIRFAMLIQMTIVFCLWNFLLFPAITKSLPTPKARRDFIQYCFGFLLSQLHLCNLPLAILNGIWGSPARSLTKIDFCVAMMFALQYVCFYLFLLDRFGLHFYFIFSPRSPLALFTYTAFVACHYAGFALWNGILSSSSSSSSLQVVGPS